MRLTTEKIKQVEIPGDPDGGYVVIRALSLHELSKIESKSSQVIVSENESGMKLDNTERENLVAMSCLKSWGNMFDVDGSDLKFGNKGIQKAAKFDIRSDGRRMRFYEWIDKEHSKFLSEVSEEEEVAEKN